MQLYNGGLECELREYVIFAGNKSDFRKAGGRIKEERTERPVRATDSRGGNDRNSRGGKDDRRGRNDRGGRRPFRGGKDAAPAKERRERPVQGEAREPKDFKKPAGRRMISTGRQPSISADKEIVVNRAMWRTRKKQNPETDKTNE